MRTHRIHLALLTVVATAALARPGVAQSTVAQAPAAQVAVDAVMPPTARKAVEDEIVRIVKAQWAAEMQHDGAAAVKNIAPEYTEFNGDFATRLEGRDLTARLSAADFKNSGKMLVAEMINPKVQLYGNVAVLSYNYVGVTQDKDGKNEPTRAKSTRVYVKQGNDWMLVHGNFAADPQPK
jgi:ketosteroid isomerase-like protein